MNSFRVSKNKIITFFTIIIVFFITLVVSNRGEYVDNDYLAYEIMFDDYKSTNVEPMYKIISMIVHSMNFDFTLLLFIFCFFSILLKIYALILAKKDRIVEGEGFIYFLLFYFFCFFALWDLTQIRASLSISFLMISFFVINLYKSIVFKILALVSHYSISFVLIFDFIYYITRRNIFLHILISICFCFFLYFLIGFTPYAVYDVTSYSEKFNPISFKNIFLIITFFLIYFTYKENWSNGILVRKLSALSISLLIMYYIFGLKYPSVAIRVSDLSLFFGLLSLTFVRVNSILILYKYIVLIILSIYFTYSFYFSGSSIIRLDQWGLK